VWKKEKTFPPRCPFPFWQRALTFCPSPIYVREEELLGNLRLTWDLNRSPEKSPKEVGPPLSSTLRKDNGGPAPVSSLLNALLTFLLWKGKVEFCQGKDPFLFFMRDVNIKDVGPPSLSAESNWASFLHTHDGGVTEDAKSR